MAKKQKIKIDTRKKYNYLRIIGEVPIDQRLIRARRRVIVHCDCGVETTRDLQNIINGSCKSCGCKRMELQKAKFQQNLINKYIGKKFGRLTVLSLSHLDKNYGKTNWDKYLLCQCDCGKQKTALATNLCAHKTQSCGCLSIEVHKNKDPWDHEYRAWKQHCADTRLISFNLTKDEFLNLVQSNCHYCGSEPKTKTRIKTPFLRNGIDRLSYTIGYESSNCVTCCFTCNRAKNRMEYKEFLEWISRIKNHNIAVIS